MQWKLPRLFFVLVYQHSGCVLHTYICVVGKDVVSARVLHAFHVLSTPLLLTVRVGTNDRYSHLSLLRCLLRSESRLTHSDLRRISMFMYIYIAICTSNVS